MFKNMRVSWKTTIAGLLGALVFVAGNQGLEVVAVNSWGEVLGILLVALGLGQARDGDKRSEESL